MVSRRIKRIISKQSNFREKRKEKHVMDDINDVFTAAKLNDVVALADLQLDIHFDVNMQDDSGLTLLHHAASTLAGDAVEWLLKQPNIDATLLDNFNRTAVTVAFENFDELADDLINKLNPHCYPWLYQSND